MTSTTNPLFFLLSFFLLTLNHACDAPADKNHTSNDITGAINNTLFNYGTESDSARFYYIKGWTEILDNGRWTESEMAYKKAIEFDPNYTLAKSVAGRLIKNLEEREITLQEILKDKDKVNTDVKLLLDVYLLSMESLNNMDKRIKGTPEFTIKRKQTAETNFRKFIHKYPEDDYVKAEYIEWLNYIHGPQVALDSLHQLATERQKQLGFYISFAASLELELDNIDSAIALSKDLKPLMIDSTYTSYLKLRAEILMAQDSLNKAKQYIDKVVRIDPNHILAVRLQSEIDNKLKNK